MWRRCPASSTRSRAWASSAWARAATSPGTSPAVRWRASRRRLAARHGGDGHAVAELFRDSDALRQSREKARLEFLYLTHGWTAERFRAELEQRLGASLRPGVAEDPPDDADRDHVGIHPQRQQGHAYVGSAVLRGRLTPPQMRAAADLASRFGSGEIRTTGRQSLLIPNVRQGHARALARELEAIGLPVQASPFRRGNVACTGSEFCKLALTETKGFSRWLVEELEARLPGYDQHLRLHVTGCPNSCGQHWTADIGIEGKKLKVDGAVVDAYYFCVGGGLGRGPALARPVGDRVAADEVPAAVERILRAYLADRRDGETFRAFCRRHTDAELRGALAGEPVAAVARDLPFGPAPHGED